MENSVCFTYFKVVSDSLDALKEFIQQTNIQNYQLIKKGDLLNSSTRKLLLSSQNELEIGMNTTYDVDMNHMVRKTLEEIMNQTDLLRLLKKQFHFEYYLERVPSLSLEADIHPILSLDTEIIDFLALSGCQDDLDYYLI